jgi:hypothetical protein
MIRGIDGLKLITFKYLTKLLRGTYSIRDNAEMMCNH